MSIALLLRSDERIGQHGREARPDSGTLGDAQRIGPKLFEARERRIEILGFVVLQDADFPLSADFDSAVRRAGSGGRRQEFWF